ncbi:MAG: gamma-glutamyltransferase, partial [Gemmatimonadota bacterium]|nr:gamma-glutamyltransferase [Gemmatimonadota bacterium]
MSGIDVGQIGWKAESKTGVVAAGGAGAVAAGVEILDRGGNAADAAVATIFALNVTDHGACSIGGEVPLLIFDAGTSEVKALSGQGRAPRSQEAIDWYMEHGIPGDGDMKMAPVPSVVDLCITTLRRYGTMSFEEIIAPVLALLDAGEDDWHPNLARTLRKLIEEEHLTSGSRA